jgi:phage terminase large subunit-like protein
MQKTKKIANINLEKEELASKCRGSFLFFCETFFKLVTGRDFIIPNPQNREAHTITIAKALTRASRLEIPSNRLIINVPPGHGKSTLLSFWTAWTMTHNPRSNYLYITYSKTLATKHTEMIRRIMMLRHYEFLFDVYIKSDSKARDLFGTTAGGSIGAYGSSGSITGQDAGLPGCEEFTGAVIMDDSHKPDEVHSDVIRKRVIDNYSETIMQRARSDKVPFIYIGQRLHEDDLPAYLLSGKDGYVWESVILKSIDDAGNALYPEVFPVEMLTKRQQTDPYVFASQFQQDPIPAGGALFKREWFVMTDDDPAMVATFITADTAETSKSYNDATVFSFWGVYEIEELGEKTGDIGLHWIDCVETRIEPKDLKDTFLQFYQQTLSYKPRPTMAAIEKKSTGVTLVSTLQDMRTLQIREIERNRNSGSKTQRFLNAQPFVASKKVSMTASARHVNLCINHMVKITANDTHKFDDIGDTLSDAIHLTFDLRLFSLDTEQTTANPIPERYNDMFC